MERHIYDLFFDRINRIKPTGKDGWIGICPFPEHDDTDPSFSWNSEGLYKCFGCGASGNAVTFAKAMGIANWTDYITGDYKNGASMEQPVLTRSDSTREKSLDDKSVEWWSEMLINIAIENRSKWENQKDRIAIASLWDDSVLEDLDVGLFDDNTYSFSTHDKDGNIINIQRHKGKFIGHPDNKRQTWYLRHKIASYSKDKPLIICEGKKDATTLYSKDYQVTTSGGTSGIPRVPETDTYDFDLFDKWSGKNERIFIVWDNDDSGIKGSRILADAMIKHNPSLNIVLCKWDKNLPKGYDVTDAFVDDPQGQNFLNALHVDAEKIEPTYPVSSFDNITADNIDSIKENPEKWVADYFVPYRASGILAGRSGANKSYIGLLIGLKIANDYPSIMGFDVMLKGQRVLYVDTEIGTTKLADRIKDLRAKHNFSLDRFFGLAKKKKLDDVFPQIQQMVKFHKTNVIIFDCLLPLAQGRDMSKNCNIDPIIDEFDVLRDEFKQSILIIHHFNKGRREDGSLDVDMMNGGGRLNGWAESIVFIEKGNKVHPTNRIMQQMKVRHDVETPSPFLLEWDTEDLEMTNKGITEDASQYTMPTAKAQTFLDVLDTLPDDEEFSGKLITDYFEERMGIKIRQAREYQKQLVNLGYLDGVRRGVYKKRFTRLKDAKEKTNG